MSLELGTGSEASHAPDTRTDCSTFVQAQVTMRKVAAKHENDGTVLDEITVTLAVRTARRPCGTAHRARGRYPPLGPEVS